MWHHLRCTWTCWVTIRTVVPTWFNYMEAFIHWWSSQAEWLGSINACASIKYKVVICKWESTATTTSRVFWWICGRLTCCWPDCYEPYPMRPAVSVTRHQSNIESIGITDYAPWLWNISTVFWKVVKLHPVIYTSITNMISAINSDIKIKKSDIYPLSFINFKGPCLCKYKSLSSLISTNSCYLI